MYRLTLLIFTALISFPATADWKKMEPRDCAVKAISQILEGGELKFVMGPNPNKNFGKEKIYRPASIVY